MHLRKQLHCNTPDDKCECILFILLDLVSS